MTLIHKSLTHKKTFNWILLLLALILALAAFVQVGVTYAQAEGDGEGGESQNPLCTDPEAKPHPVLAGIAERYGADYQQLVDWKCIDNYGVGEILVALQTAGLIDEDAHALLGKKGKGNAWGKVWKEAGLIGNESDAGPPPWAQNNKDNPGGGPPDHANGQGQGKPDDVGNPNALDDDDDDKPGNGNQGGGPPDHANNDKDKPENENKGSDDDDDDDDGANSLNCESGLVLDGDTVEDAEKLAEEYDLQTFEIIALLCGGDSLSDIEGALEGDD